MRRSAARPVQVEISIMLAVSLEPIKTHVHHSVGCVLVDGTCPGGYSNHDILENSGKMIFVFLVRYTIDREISFFLNAICWLKLMLSMNTANWGVSPLRVGP